MAIRVRTGVDKSHLLPREKFTQVCFLMQDAPQAQSLPKARSIATPSHHPLRAWSAGKDNKNARHAIWDLGTQGGVTAAARGGFPIRRALCIPIRAAASAGLCAPCAWEAPSQAISNFIARCCYKMMARMQARFRFPVLR